MQSRYYDPELGRFLNSDSYVSTGQGILGNNMFAYCNNNPVRYFDVLGRQPESIAEKEDEEDRQGYRFVGLGFQGEFNVGSYEVGVEIVVYYDGWIVQYRNVIARMD